MTDLHPNAWFWFVLITVLLGRGLDLVATWLNLRSLRPELPAAMADVFDAEKYAESQAYTRANARFGVVETAFSLVLFFVFWLAGGFGWLDGIVRGWNLGGVVSGLVYVSLIFLGHYVLTLPLELYDTFVIEERFGFNRTTVGTFIVDQVKALALGAVLGLPLLALILWIFGTLPAAWFWGWLAMTVVTLVLAYVAPTWIMPLFNKFEPLEDGKLKSEIHAMAGHCDFPLREVMVMDGSKRSTKSNAFFTGFGKNKRIALFDTLVERHTTEELVAVLAHEIGHYKRRHIQKGMALGILTNGLFFFLLGRVIENRGLFDAFGVADTSIYLSLIFFGILVQPLSQIIGVLGNVFSRKWEFEADSFAAVVTKTPGALVSALKKLSKDNLSNLTPHPLNVFLNYSHPPVLQRIEALESETAG
ncbi:MAG: M48 family metallopeptidase [Verrucomicrobiae bacterium]|nr:M48 family metallopeptidase [Verrucomicrobiae bacterium]